MINTRSTNETTHQLSRISGSFREYFNKLSRTRNIDERNNYIHKIYIIVNANIEVIMNEHTLALTIYKCALRNRISIIRYPRQLKKMIHSQKQMEQFIEYFETFCLKGTLITSELFHYIISFV